MKQYRYETVTAQGSVEETLAKLNALGDRGFRIIKQNVNEDGGYYWLMERVM